MRPAREFLEICKNNAKRNLKWHYEYGSLPLKPSVQKEIIDLLLGMSQDETWAQYLSDSALNQRLLADSFEVSIISDLEKKVRPEHLSILKSCIIGIVPLGFVNAHVRRTDNFGQPLDRFVIFINYGLYLACSALADALTFENLQGDFADFRRSGQPYFNCAVKSYIDHKAFDDYQLPLHEYPPHISAAIMEQSGRLTAIMLQFIVLHEFGHIINGDLGDQDSEMNLSPSGLELKLDAQPGKRREIGADLYAIETLSDWEGSSPSAWPNFAQAYYFFRWLEVVEEHRQQSSPSHPPASMRKQCIANRARKLARHAPADDYILIIENMIESWRNIL